MAFIFLQTAIGKLQSNVISGNKKSLLTIIHSCRYKGDYLNGIKEGEGVFWWTSGPHAGDKYIGFFQEDRRHGHGHYIYSGGEIFAGEWEAGHQHGSGRIMYPNGNLLEGTWKNGKRDGTFYFTFQNGEKFKGRFANNARVGSWTKVEP